MTRKGPTRRVDGAFGRGRLENARAFRDSAAQALALAEPQVNANPILSDLVISAIAYADAVCSVYGGRVNQDDHAAAVKTLRAVLGTNLPAAELKRFQRLLGQKQDAQYGARHGSLEGATLLMQDLEAFAGWAEAIFAERR